MTVTPTRGSLDTKAGRTLGGGDWDESLHPRDRLGRFIETGAEVRVFGGQGGKVVANVGGGRIEIERPDGSHAIVHRNYLTVVKRPDGSAPTAEADESVDEMAETGPVDEGAEEVDADDTDVAQITDEEIDAAVRATENLDDEAAADLRAAAKAYQAAVGNGIPDDEADERAALLAELDLIDPDDELPETRALRASVTQEPDQATGDVPEPEGAATGPAPNSQRLVDTPTPGESRDVNGQAVTVGDHASTQHHQGEVVGFTPTGGIILRDENGNDWPYKPDADVTITPGGARTGQEDRTDVPAGDPAQEGPNTPQADAQAETAGTGPERFAAVFQALADAATPDDRRAAVREIHRRALNERAARTRDVLPNDGFMALNDLLNAAGDSDDAKWESATSALREALQDDRVPARWKALADVLDTNGQGASPEAPPEAQERERVTVDDVEPGDVLESVRGRVTVSEVTRDRRAQGRGAGPGGQRPDIISIVGVDEQGNVRRLPNVTRFTRLTRVGRGDAPAMPERPVERIKPADLRVGDRINADRGDAVVVHLQTGEGDTGQQTDIYIDTLDGNGPQRMRVRNNQYVEVTGHDQPVDARHERIIARAQELYSGNERDTYFDEHVTQASKEDRDGTLPAGDETPGETPTSPDVPEGAEQVDINEIQQGDTIQGPDGPTEALTGGSRFGIVIERADGTRDIIGRDGDTTITRVSKGSLSQQRDEVAAAGLDPDRVVPDGRGGWKIRTESVPGWPGVSPVAVDYVQPGDLVYTADAEGVGWVSLVDPGTSGAQVREVRSVGSRQLVFTDGTHAQGAIDVRDGGPGWYDVYLASPNEGDTETPDEDDDEPVTVQEREDDPGFPIPPPPETPETGRVRPRGDVRVSSGLMATDQGAGTDITLQDVEGHSLDISEDDLRRVMGGHLFNTGTVSKIGDDQLSVIPSSGAVGVREAWGRDDQGQWRKLGDVTQDWNPGDTVPGAETPEVDPAEAAVREVFRGQIGNYADTATYKRQDGGDDVPEGVELWTARVPGYRTTNWVAMFNGQPITGAHHQSRDDVVYEVEWSRRRGMIPGLGDAPPQERPDAPETRPTAPETPPVAPPPARPRSAAWRGGRALTEEDYAVLDAARERYEGIAEVAEDDGDDAKARRFRALADADTLTLSPNGAVAYYKQDRDTWVMLDAQTGQFLGADYNSTWGGRRQADKVAKAYSEALDANGDPFPWDKTADRETRDGWRSADGRSWADELLYRKGALDVAGGHAETYAAKRYEEMRATPQTPETPETPPRRQETIAQAQARLRAWIASEHGDTEQADRLLEMLNDPYTMLTPDGEFLIHRTAVDDVREWRVSSSGDMQVAFKAPSREEAIALALGIEAAVDENGRPFNFHDPGVNDRIREDTWRDTEGRSIKDVAKAVREDVARTGYDPDEWADRPNDLDDEYDDEYDEDEDEDAGDDEEYDGGPDDLHPKNPDLERVMREVFEWRHDASGFRTEDYMYVEDVDPYGYDGKVGMQISGSIVDADGIEVGEVTRSVYFAPDGRIEVHHDLLTIEQEHQGQGFADAYYKHLYDEYERRGVDVVTIQANIDVGGYAWAQRGFDWDGGSMDSGQNYGVRDRYVGHLNALADLDPSGLMREPSRRVASAAPSLTEEQRDRIRDFAQRIEDGEDYSPKDLANALKDIQWTHTTEEGAEIRMWPGKHAMLGLNWYGTFDVADRDRGGDVTPETPETPETPPVDVERPRFIPLDTEIQYLTLEEIDDELTAQETNLDEISGAGYAPGDPDYDQTQSLIDDLYERRSDRWMDLADDLAGPDSEAANLGDLRPGDQFIVPVEYESNPTLAKIDWVEENPDGTINVGITTEDSVYILRKMARNEQVLAVRSTVPDPDPTGPMLTGDDVDEETAKTNAKAAFSYTHEATGWRTDFHNVGTSSFGRRIDLVGTIRDANGNKVGEVSRSVYRNRDGEVEVHHNLLTIDSAYQSQGFADAYYKHLYEQYEKRGVDIVTINANIDVGGYAWAQRGFDWSSGRMGNYLRDEFVSYYRNLASDRWDDELQGLTDEDRDRINAFADRLAAGEEFTPKDLANSLKDITWQRTLHDDYGNETGRVKMWPGKYVMLGSDWYGTMRVRGEKPKDEVAYRVPDTQVEDMSDEALAAEADKMNDTDLVNRLSDGGYDTEAGQAIERLTAIRTEQKRRWDEKADGLLAERGETIHASEVREGDEIVLPYLLAAQHGPPEMVTVLSYERIEDDAFGERHRLSVRHADGSISDPLLTRFSGFEVRRATGGPTKVESTSWGKVAVGDTVMVDGFDGEGRVPANVAAIYAGDGEDDDADYLAVTAVLPGGRVVEISANKWEAVDKVTGPVATTPAPPRDPADMSDEDITAEIDRLGVEFVAAVGDEEATRRIGSRLVALQEALNGRQRRPDVPPKEQPVQPTPLGSGEATALPWLNTYQRRNLVALGLDKPSSGADPRVMQAAARIRHRMPLSAGQAEALAAHFRTVADDPALGARDRRSTVRLAQAFEAANAAALGRSAPEPEIDGVTKARPGGVTVGDQIALPDRDGNWVSAKVADHRSILSGRMFEVTLEHPDGTREFRLLQHDQDLFVLPDLPPDKPAEPAPDMEYVGAADLRAGDTIRVMRRGEYVDAVVDSVEEPTAWQTDYVVNFTYTQGDGSSRSDSQGYDRGGHVLRVERGEASADQPPGIPVPAEVERTPIDSTEIAVGDRIEYLQGSVPTVGTVLEITRVATTGNGTREGREFVILDDTGDTRSMSTFGEVIRVGNAGDNIALTVRQAAQRREREAHLAKIDAGLVKAQKRAYLFLAGAARLAVGHSREQMVREVEQYVSRESSDWQSIEDIGLPLRMAANPDYQGVGVLETTKEAIKAARRDAADRLIEAINGAEPLPGEAEHEALARILTQYENNPPQRHMRQVADTLVTAFAALPEDEVDIPDVVVDIPDGDLRTRMDAYRAAMGEGAVFGHTTTRRATFGEMSLESLERGEAPEVVWKVENSRDRSSTDDGPGETAMRHFDILQAAGQELDDRVTERMREIMRERVASYGIEVEGDDLTPAGISFSVREQQGDARRAAGRRARELYGQNVDLESDQQYKELQARSLELDKAYDALRFMEGDARRQASLEILASIRDLGGHTLDYSYGRVTRMAGRRMLPLTEERTAALTQAMRDAEAVYPTDWLEAAHDYVGTANDRNGRRGDRSIDLSASDRGGAGYDANITLSNREYERRVTGASGYTSVAVHELGHFMERSVPGLLAAEEAFLWHRTSTGTGVNRTREDAVNMANHQGDSTQWGYIDRFAVGYSGVDYQESARRGRAGGGEAYEIFTMGVEGLLAGANYIDDDYRRFMLGAMALLGKPQAPRERGEDESYPGDLLNRPRQAPRVTQSNEPVIEVTPRPRSTRGRQVTPTRDLRLPRGTGQGSVRFYEAPEGTQRAIRDTLEVIDLNGYRVEVRDDLSRVYTNRASLYARVLDAQGQHVGRLNVDVEYQRTGAIIVETRGLSELRDESVPPEVKDAYIDHLKAQAEALGATEIVAKSTGHEQGLDFARRGFTWGPRQPDSGAKAAMIRRLRAWTLDSTLTDEEKAQVSRLMQQMNNANVGVGPMPEPSDIAKALPDIRVQTGTGDTRPLGEALLASIGMWDAVYKTGIRRQPRS